MKAMIVGTALLVLLSAQALAAQQPTDTRTAADVRTDVEQIVQRSGMAEALDELATAAAPELERTMGQLAETLSALTRRIADDPQLRSSALRVAQGMVDVAQLVLVEQTRVLDEALRVAAERLGEMSAPEGR